MVRTKDHAHSAYAGAKKTYTLYRYVHRLMHGLALLCALGALIASAVAAHKANDLRKGDGDADSDEIGGDNDGDVGHYKTARDTSIAGAVWSALTLLQQSGSGLLRWKHVKKLQKLRRRKEVDSKETESLKAPHTAAGEVDLPPEEARRRMLIDIAIQSVVIVFGVFVLAIWANPLMQRTYKDAAFVSSLKAWGILGWIALALLIVLLLFTVVRLCMRRRSAVDETV